MQAQNPDPTSRTHGKVNRKNGLKLFSELTCVLEHALHTHTYIIFLCPICTQREREREAGTHHLCTRRHTETRAHPDAHYNTFKKREGYRGAGDLIRGWWEYKLVQPPWKSVRFLKNLKIGSPSDPDSSLLGKWNPYVRGHLHRRQRREDSQETEAAQVSGNRRVDIFCF